MSPALDGGGILIAPISEVEYDACSRSSFDVCLDRRHRTGALAHVCAHSTYDRTADVQASTRDHDPGRVSNRTCPFAADIVCSSDQCHPSLRRYRRRCATRLLRIATDPLRGNRSRTFLYSQRPSRHRAVIAVCWTTGVSIPAPANERRASGRPTDGFHAQSADLAHLCDFGRLLRELRDRSVALVAAHTAAISAWPGGIGNGRIRYRIWPD